MESIMEINNVKNIVDRTIADYNATIKVLNVLIEAMRPFDGKKLTKRELTKINKALEPLGCYAAYRHLASMVYLHVYSNTDRSFEVRDLVMYDSDIVFPFETFQKNMTRRIESHQETIKELSETDLSKVQADFEKLKSAMVEVEDVPYTIKNEFLKAFDLSFDMRYRG